ncbi:MAG: molybdenum cofactor guanylyltransferase [Hydrogenophilus sp.]|nr:molybdenum cofactor guanylyltransferase [Hydrogenophilus sp.]
MNGRAGNPEGGIGGLILAGGRARRMGGVDKGWVEWRGRPLVAWVAERLRPQVDSLVVSANRTLERYRTLGATVVADEGDFRYQGPLAGIAAGLAATPCRWLAVVPCDAPCLAEDLVARFWDAARREEERVPPPVFVAHDGKRPQWTFLLLHQDHRPRVEEFLAAGGRRVEAWVVRQPHRFVSFADRLSAFANANSLEELHRLVGCV